MASVYLWIKCIHLLFVMAWVASVFYLPRTLVNLAESAEAGEPEAVRARLLLMGRRLYKFGHMMFGFAFLAGLLMWQGFRVAPQHFGQIGGGWLHAKLGLVAVLLAYFVWCGRHVKAIAAGAPAGTSKRWRLWNELPILLLFAIIFLVLAKPF
jgi:protoporphyrinogen IX oxidase